MTAIAVWSSYTVVNCCFIAACGHWQKILVFSNTAFYLQLAPGTAFPVGHLCWAQLFRLDTCAGCSDVGGSQKAASHNKSGFSLD